MFHHVKELQFDARVSGPDPRFARLLLEQFGGPNGELKAAMQYFVQAFSCRKPYPDKYDLLMDIAMEEFSHLEIVGATITMLLTGVNGALKDAAEQSSLMKLLNGKRETEQMAHEAYQPAVPGASRRRADPDRLRRACRGPARMSMPTAISPWIYVPISPPKAGPRSFTNTCMQFTDDPHVRESLGFLMTREVAHMQMFTAALSTVEPNFPPGILPADPRASHTYFNLSDGEDVRGPWNRGQGPWPTGEEWVYFHDPVEQVRRTAGQKDQPPAGTTKSREQLEEAARSLGKKRSQEIKSAAETGEQSWSSYPQPVRR